MLKKNYSILLTKKRHRWRGGAAQSPPCPTRAPLSAPLVSRPAAPCLATRSIYQHTACSGYKLNTTKILTTLLQWGASRARSEASDVMFSSHTQLQNGSFPTSNPQECTSVHGLQRTGYVQGSPVGGEKITRPQKEILLGLLHSNCAINNRNIVHLYRIKPSTPMTYPITPKLQNYTSYLSPCICSNLACCMVFVLGRTRIRPISRSLRPSSV